MNTPFGGQVWKNRCEAAEAEAQRLREALRKIGEAALRQNLDWMHFHETAMAEPFKAEAEAQAFCERIAALSAGAEQEGPRFSSDGGQDVRVQDD